MPHHIYKSSNSLYDYDIINIYVSLMYKLKKIGKLFRSKFVGSGPSSYKKKNLPGRGLAKDGKKMFLCNR